jgi:O-antigen ligase
MSHFIIFPFFALLLAGQKGWLPAVTPLAGGVIWALTASRATLGFGSLGIVVLFLISAMRKWTARKARVLLFSAVALALLAPVAISSLQTRFELNPLTDGRDERDILNDTAAAILSDHPMGIGENNFTVVANTHGYYDRNGMSWMSRSAIVHNIYWLTAAETGYLGIITFVVLLLQPLITALRCGWRNRNDRRGDLLLGLGVGLLVVYVHSYYEWIFVTFQCQYIYALVVGLVGALATQLGYYPRSDQIKAKTPVARKVVVTEPVI